MHRLAMSVCQHEQGLLTEVQALSAPAVLAGGSMSGSLATCVKLTNTVNNMGGLGAIADRCSLNTADECRQCTATS